MSVRSSRTSPPGGVSPGASRWSAASAPEGPPPTATASPAASPRARIVVASATVLALSLRNAAPFRRPVGFLDVWRGRRVGADSPVVPERFDSAAREDLDRVALGEHVLSP